MIPIREAVDFVEVSVWKVVQAHGSLHLIEVQSGKIARRESKRLDCEELSALDSDLDLDMDMDMN